MRSFIEKLLQVLIPEENHLRKLLALEPATLRTILPESNIYQQDLSALFDYQNKLVRILVKAVKFRNNPRARKVVAELLCEDLLEITSDANLFSGAIPILVPMPMSKKERTERGYNQCEELVKEMTKIIGSQVRTELDLLHKVRDTERQVHLSREARTKNLDRSMEVVDPHQILKDKSVVVLDDLYTTGSTFAEARRALLLGGAKSVYGLFIAH